MAPKLMWRNANQSTLETLRGESGGQYDIRLGRSKAVAEFFGDLAATTDHDGQRIEIMTERSPVPSGDGETLPCELGIRRMGESSKRRDWYIRAQRPETAHPLWRPGVGPLASTQPGTDFVLLLRTDDDLFYAGWLREGQMSELPTDLQERMTARDIDVAILDAAGAATIGRLIGHSPTDFTTVDEDDDAIEEIEQGTVEAAEGRSRTAQHVYRERSRWLRRKKIEAAGARPTCEACGFDFEERYGVRGKGFIECHHVVPVSELDPGTPTRLEDLALLCANCHRMIHAARPWIDVDDLRGILAPAP